MAKKLPPIHPGEVLREDFLQPMKLTPYAVARACGVPRTRIERLAREETPVTADTALRLARYLGTTPQFWMGMQAQYDLERAEDEAGKELRRDLQFSELDENFKAYNLFAHRHTPEITEQTGLAESQLVFATHLLPLARGILSTIYVTLAQKRSSDEVEALFRRTYAGRPMVRIWQAGALPELQHVAHTNFCDIGFALDAGGKQLILISCLDNLGKGAAGQAVQNFNHLLGSEEQTGLQ